MAAPAAPWMSGGAGVTVCSRAFLRGRRSRGFGRGGSSRRRGSSGGSRTGVPAANETASQGQPAPVSSRCAGIGIDAHRPGTQAAPGSRGGTGKRIGKGEKGCAVGQRREPAMATGRAQREAPPVPTGMSAAERGQAAKPEPGAARRQRNLGNGRERRCGEGELRGWGTRCQCRRRSGGTLPVRRCGNAGA